MTCEAGFIIAESAVTGNRLGLEACAKSMTTSLEEPPTVSLTQINLSDSIVTVVNLMCSALMPKLCS